jgi:deoxyribodipyrimidine photolyase
MVNDSAATGSGLVVRHDRPEDAIPKLAELYDVKAVYCHSEVRPYHGLSVGDYYVSWSSIVSASSS